jgi:hypothetical protein
MVSSRSTPPSIISESHGADKKKAPLLCTQAARCSSAGQSDIDSPAANGKKFSTIAAKWR